MKDVTLHVYRKIKPLEERVEELEQEKERDTEKLVHQLHKPSSLPRSLSDGPGSSTDE